MRREGGTREVLVLEESLLLLRFCVGPAKWGLPEHVPPLWGNDRRPEIGAGGDLCQVQADGLYSSTCVWVEVVPVYAASMCRRWVYHHAGWSLRRDVLAVTAAAVVYGQEVVQQGLLVVDGQQLQFPRRRSSHATRDRAAG